MHRKLLFIISIVFMLILGSAKSSSIFYEEGSSVKAQEKVIAKWTVMVFLDGDDSTLSKYTNDDVDEMEKVGSTTDVQIVVIADDQLNIDLKPGIYNVIYHPATGVGTRRTAIEEPDMSDGRTLVDYMRWTMENYPSEKFCLVLWNHGTGWKGMNVDDTTGEPYYEIELDELERSLRIIVQETGKKIDVILFDMCLMGMIEVAYQLQDLVDYIVFSEDKIPADSREYDYTLADLKASPTWSAERLAQEWVNDYVGSGGMITQSAVNMSRLPSLIEAMKNFADLLCEYVDVYPTQISTASSATKGYAVLHPDNVEYLVYADLYDFAYELNKTAIPSDLKTACSNLMSAIDYVILAKKGATDDHGLSVYFPYRNYTLNNQYAYMYMALYDTYREDRHQEITIKFAHDEGMHWDDFLRAVWFSPPAYTHDVTTNIGWGTGYSKNISTVFAPYRAQTNTTINVDVYVRNVGRSAESNVPVTLYFAGNPLETKYVSLGKKRVALLSFNLSTPSTVGTYTLTVKTELLTDENTAN
ncbi:MAG: clostripain-related cysteine peptidase, partial [Candidatus Thermoplasmatota archaeon]|nr:clostripain-related cysteine peptidase [Candidatus Thermoplasmatota archaeon]